MPSFRLIHVHEAAECPVVYATWKGHDSPLRGAHVVSSCQSGRHEIWWDVESESAEQALAQLPSYVADRSVAARVRDVEIP